MEYESKRPTVRPYLFIDCETTGVHAEARVVSIAAQLDQPPSTVICINRLIKPQGFIIPEKATEIHKISHTVASEYGDDLGNTLATLFTLMNEVKRQEGMIIAHNVDYDTRVLTYDADKVGLGPLPIYERFCTMRALIYHCKIPFKHGGGFKFPRLEEAYEWMFGRPPEVLHSARHDMLACREIFYEGKARGLWNP